MRRYKFELLFVQSPWKLGFLFIYRSVLLKICEEVTNSTKLNFVCKIFSHLLEDLANSDNSLEAVGSKHGRQERKKI